MRRIYKGKVTRDTTKKVEYYYLNCGGIIIDRELFREFEGRVVKVTVEDMEEVQVPRVFEMAMSNKVV